MEIDVNESGNIRLREVFNPVVFETEEGEKLIICIRDGRFEIKVKNTDIKNPFEGAEEYYCNYRVRGGAIVELLTTAKNSSDWKYIEGMDNS